MKRKNAMLIAIIIPLITCLIALLLVFSKHNKSNDDTFPIERYIENPTAFAGHNYALTASVESQLAYSDTRGRILLVNATNSQTPLPILVLPTISDFNPRTNQRYELNVRIDGDGKIILTAFEKL